MGSKIENKIVIYDTYGECFVNKGKSFKFDLEDEKVVRSHHWYYENNKGQEQIRTWLNGGKRTSYTMVLGYANKRTCAKNGDVLDLRKDNLEMLTHTEIRYRNPNTNLPRSGVHGVVVTRANRYQAKIVYRGEFINLGIYDTLEEAKHAREIGEKTYYRH